MLLDALDSDDTQHISVALDEASKQLARDVALRQQLGADLALWSRLDALWTATSTAAQSGSDGDWMKITLSLARFTRNIVAGVATNQQRAFEFEERIRDVLYNQTSYIALHDDAALPLTRMLVQALSNIVTSNELVLAEFWATYINLPEQRNIILRLLQADDEPIIQATLVLLYNCLHDSPSRREQLISTPGGNRVQVLLLDRTQHLFELEEEGAAFKIAYELYAHLFDNGQAAALWAALQPRTQVSAPG